MVWRYVKIFCRFVSFPGFIVFGILFGVAYGLCEWVGYVWERPVPRDDGLTPEGE